MYIYIESFLTLVRHLSSKDGPELLHICTLWVNPFFNSLQLVGSAAHVLLCLNVGGQIHRLQRETNNSEFSLLKHPNPSKKKQNFLKEFG